MNNAPSTASAEVDEELVQILYDHSREVGLEQAAESEARVDEVQTLQREEVINLVGGDETAAQVQPLVDAVDDKIAEGHTQTMAAIEDTPDAIIFKRKNTMAAYQEDGTGKVGIADDAFVDLNQVKERSRHEGEHIVQEDGAPSAPILKTGDPIIDAKAELDRGDSREDGAMKKQGGVSPNQTDDYKAIVKREDAMQKFLTANGENGVALSREAALTNEGFRKMHAAMIRATMRKNMEELVLAA